MTALVGIDALVLIKGKSDTKWLVMPERNEFSISVSVETAEHKVFVQSLDLAWVGKARTWMNWNGSLSGYMDDADDSLYERVLAGEEVLIRFYDSRKGCAFNVTTGVPEDTEATPAPIYPFWEGKVLLGSVEHGTGTDDFSTLNVDFEGIGPLVRVTMPESTEVRIPNVTPTL